MTARVLSADELHSAAETLDYEIGMFVSTARMLTGWPLGAGDLHNAVLESFLVHFRQLIEFLAETSDGSKGRDVRAIHFCGARRAKWEARAKQHREDLVVGPQKEPRIKDDIDRQVVHLTAHRGGPHKTVWHFPQHVRDILERLDEWVQKYATDLPPVLVGGIAALARGARATPPEPPAESSMTPAT